MDPLLDDSLERAGAKFATMDLIGLPFQTIIGPKSAAQQQVEIKDRRSSQRVTLSPEEALNYFTEKLRQ